MDCDSIHVLCGSIPDTDIAYMYGMMLNFLLRRFPADVTALSWFPDHARLGHCPDNMLVLPSHLLESVRMFGCCQATGVNVKQHLYTDCFH